MGVFGGIKDKKAPINSEFFRAGRYLTYIRAFKTMKSRKQANLALFEMLVVAVLDDAAASAEAKGAHSAGHQVSWVLDLAKDPSLPALKGALMVITGCPEDQIDEPFCEQLASAANPLEGFFVEWDNRVIKTKSTGQPFTLVKARRRWTAEDVKAVVPETVLTSLKITLDRAG